MIGLGHGATSKFVTSDWIEVYRRSVQNAEIAGNASETFGIDQQDLEARQKHGSFNRLILKNRSNAPVRMSLDGVHNIMEVAASENVILEPSDGIFFDFIVITDLSGSTISASLITITFGKSIKEVIR